MSDGRDRSARDPAVSDTSLEELTAANFWSRYCALAQVSGDGVGIGDVLRCTLNQGRRMKMKRIAGDHGEGASQARQADAAGGRMPPQPAASGALGRVPGSGRSKPTRYGAFGRRGFDI